MKAYSGDLRKKVLTAYQNGKGSMRQLTEKSDVSLTSVSGPVKNFRQNGHIRPKPHGGGKTPAADKQGCEFLTGLIERQTDLTLKELCEHYGQKSGKKVSKSAPDRTLKKSDITRRKKELYDTGKNTERVKRLTEEYSEKIKAEDPDNPVFTDADRSDPEYDSSLRKSRRREKSDLDPPCFSGAEDICDRSAVNGRNGRGCNSRLSVAPK